jgi:transposase InsO family protein
MSRKGNCWDNAVVESFFVTLKDELEILDGLVRDPEQLLYDLWMWIEGFYNRKASIPPSVIPLPLPLRNAKQNVIM